MLFLNVFLSVFSSMGMMNVHQSVDKQEQGICSNSFLDANREKDYQTWLMEEKGFFFSTNLAFHLVDQFQRETVATNHLSLPSIYMHTKA
tara:strand:- start:84 stop:353 length:270 start_codon:yes stop_codon:yes gene_type:complete